MAVQCGIWCGNTAFLSGQSGTVGIFKTLLCGKFLRAACVNDGLSPVCIIFPVQLTLHSLRWLLRWLWFVLIVKFWKEKSRVIESNLQGKWSSHGFSFGNTSVSFACRQNLGYKKRKAPTPYFHEYLPVVIFNSLYLPNLEMQGVCLAHRERRLLQTDEKRGEKAAAFMAEKSLKFQMSLS